MTVLEFNAMDPSLSPEATVAFGAEVRGMLVATLSAAPLIDVVEQGAAYVVSTIVVRIGDAVRVQVRVVSVATGKVLVNHHGTLAGRPTTTAIADAVAGPILEFMEKGPAGA